MKRFGQWVIAGFALGMLLAGPPQVQAEERGVCLVCQVTEGEAGLEPIKAVRNYQGKTYGFCSEKCAKAFEADPIAYLPPTFPRPAPAFALETLDGDAMSNDSLKGKVVLLDFWATWCGPCRKSMAGLQTLHDKYSDQGLVVLGVSIDEGPHAKVRSYVERKGYTYPIAVDSKTSPAWGVYRVVVVPTVFLIDREGRIVAQWTGATDTRELEARLAEMLGEN